MSLTLGGVNRCDPPQLRFPGQLLWLRPCFSFTGPGKPPKGKSPRIRTNYKIPLCGPTNPKIGRNYFKIAKLFGSFLQVFVIFLLFSGMGLFWGIFEFGGFPGSLAHPYIQNRTKKRVQSSETHVLITTGSITGINCRELASNRHCFLQPSLLTIQSSVFALMTYN